MKQTMLLRLALVICAGASLSTRLSPAAATEVSTSRIEEAVRDIRAVAVPARVVPGASFTVTVSFTVAQGLHIQAAKPLQDYLIGTELRGKPADGVIWQAPRYPVPAQRTDPVLGTMAEYSGQVRIDLSGTVQSNTAPGARPISLVLRYQACSDKGACFPPKTIGIDAVMHVVAAGEIQGQEQPEDAGTQPARSVEPNIVPGAAKTDEHGGTRSAPRHLLAWEPFSGRRLAELTAAGRTVLIDFTADWCPNCKLNELLALNTARTADLVRRNGITALLADFTRQDPEVRAWLGKFNSVSVPLTVILPADRPTQPILLRDTYRQGTLLAALEQAGPSQESRFEKNGTGRQAASGPQRLPLTLDTPISLSEPSESIGWYLLAGFIGGFVLNFMPCVLPVISIKVLSLLGQAGQSRRRVLGLGLAFSAGMIDLFLALGLLVTVAGQTWGALFQSITFLVVMLGIVVAMACSLFGVFTLSVPAAVGDADAAIEGEGYVGSFGKGVLAVLLGTPCSGPLLGSALAWAAAKSAAGRPDIGMLVFLCMGLGMASPFLVLAAKPDWMRYLPRPGAWMETFKQAMGFLLLLTAVYILYLLQDRVLAALLYSLGVSFAAWLYGRLVRPDRSRNANWIGRAIVVAVIAAVVWLSFAGVPTMAAG
jgi:thiol:disulfide interchange protein